MGIGSVTPKARLYQIYPGGKGLKILTESVPTHAAGGVPGSISFFKQNPTVNYRCTLTLPDGSQVVSDLCPRKKDAEHNAAQQALDKMCVPQPRALDVLTVEEKWENLVQRILETFSDKNVLTYMPLKEHFRTALKNQGPMRGHVPLAVISTMDAKINTLCKVIDRKTESDPIYAMSILCSAAKKCPSVNLHMETLSISRVESFSPDVERQLFDSNRERCSSNSPSFKQEECGGELTFAAVKIPSSGNRAVFQTQVVVQRDSYYLDVLAREIGLQYGWRLAISRPIGKSHPFMRLYWASPTHLPTVHIPDSDFSHLVNDDEAQRLEDLRRYSVKNQDSLATDQSKNVRASLLVGYPVYGDVILAAVGGDWRSSEVYASDVSLSFYYRILLSKFPEGNYKLSRGAVLAANLPLTFSCRLLWKGASPRGLLLDFLQQHRLPEPVFTLSYPGSESEGHSDLVGRASEATETKEFDEEHGETFRTIESEDLLGSNHSKVDEDSHSTVAQGGPFFGTVRVEFQKGSALEFHSGPHRNRYEAMQSCALQAVHSCRPWFDHSLAGCYEPILPGFANVDADEHRSSIRHGEVLAVGTDCSPESSDRELFEDDLAMDSSQIGRSPPPGALVTIRYTVRCLTNADLWADSSTVLLEKNDQFAFELGSDGVIAGVDQAVANMTVGQTAYVLTSLPATFLILASAELAAENGSLAPGPRMLKYTLQLLRYAEPQEERMEAALFKPSLSKQRLGCAVSFIHKLQAKSLMDVGCGSGSLMESLLGEETGLEEIVGLDISPKTLLRAAKVLSAKLVGHTPGKDTLKTIKLFEGSIADFNVLLQGFDVAVCLEVVEHMDPEPLSMFGSTVLGRLQPRVVIVSTPNFEYNPILQGLDWDPSTNSLLAANYVSKDAPRAVPSSTEELASVEKRACSSQGKHSVETLESSKSRISQQVKFRNDDHRFEWTRAEFRQWAGTLAEEFLYDVTFDGVGGSGEDEGPGYASQIAIFTRTAMSVKVGLLNADSCSENGHESVGGQLIDGDAFNSNKIDNGAEQLSNGDTCSGRNGDNNGAEQLTNGVTCSRNRSDNGAEEKQLATGAAVHTMVWQWNPVDQGS